MPKSVLEAIQLGEWDFEPDKVTFDAFDATDALPGSEEKVTILCERVQQGLPLWHPSDRRDYENRLRAELGELELVGVD